MSSPPMEIASPETLPQDPEEIMKKLEQTRSEIAFLARNIVAAGQTLGAFTGAAGSVRDSILEKLELAARSMSRLNILTRHLGALNAERSLGIDMAAVHHENEVIGEEFQRACNVLDDLEDSVYESDSFIQDMDEVMDQHRRSGSVFDPHLERIRHLQTALANVARGGLFRSQVRASPSGSPPSDGNIPSPTAEAPSPIVRDGPSPSFAVVDHAAPLPSEPVGLRHRGLSVTSVDSTLAAPDSSSTSLADDAAADGPLLHPDGEDATPSTPSTPSSSSSSAAEGGWSKARKVLLPMSGGVAGGLLLGPAGLLLGVKGLALIGAMTAVGVGVGVISGTAVSKTIDAKHKKETEERGREEEGATVPLLSDAQPSS